MPKNNKTPFEIWTFEQMIVEDSDFSKLQRIDNNTTPWAVEGPFFSQTSRRFQLDCWFLSLARRYQSCHSLEHLFA